MLRHLACLIVLVTLGAGCSDSSDTGSGETSLEPTSVQGLRCPGGVTDHAIYDYGDAPAPDGEEPIEAAVSFFGSGLPEDGQLERSGSDVHVNQDGETVAIIGLLDVPGGFVVESYDACKETITAP